MAAAHPNDGSPRALVALSSGLALAASGIALRLIIAAAWDGAPSPGYLLGCLLSGAWLFLAGALLGVLGASASVARVLRGIGVMLVIVEYTVAGHYHAFFERLPGVNAVESLRELSALRSSVSAHAPLPVVAAEVLGALLGYALLEPTIRRRLSPHLTRPAPLALLATVACGLLGSTTMWAGSGQLYYGAAEPLVHVAIMSRGVARSTDVDAPTGNPLSAVLSALGSTRVNPPNPLYPLCAPTTVAPTGKAGTPSILLLLLESVDARALAATFEGRPVMPNLQRIVEDGVHFDRFYAVGERSRQALPALMAGVVALPFRTPLSHAPLPDFDGLPAALGELGYRSVYVHGSDLSFEQQRRFLRQVGVQEFIEHDPTTDDGSRGWGLPDGLMLDRTRAWVEQHHERHGDRPYFATFASLSSHDPYIVPERYAGLFAPEDAGSADHRAFLRSLAYVDDELGRFYGWYREHEAPRGTLLAIVADHAPPLEFPDDPQVTTTGEREYRFRVPLVWVGLDEERASAVDTTRLGSQVDFPDTVFGLLGARHEGCWQGRDLMAPGPFPRNRFVTAVAGEDDRMLYAFRDSKRYLIDSATQEVQAHDVLANGGFREAGAVTPEVQQFLQHYLQLGGYLASSGRFSPPAKLEHRATLPTVAQPILVSHRGHTAGADQGPAENTFAAMEAAIEAGFEWVEIDVAVTADQVPVLHHDGAVRGPDGQVVRFPQRTLEQLRTIPELAELPLLEEAVRRYAPRIGMLVELKSVGVTVPPNALARSVVRILRRAQAEDRARGFIVDSFAHRELATVAAFSDIPVGYDFPQQPAKPEWLDFSVRSGFSWIYLRHDLITPELVRAAHGRGLRVMAYTVNDPSEIAQLMQERPDGIITDMRGVWGPAERPLPPPGDAPK
ncbi:MAG: sulfatase-like hydrolase/transferase [Myxococcales bacterium]